VLGSKDVLEYYDSMAGASRRMLAAARDDDWDTVMALERDCAAIVEHLRRAGEPPLSGDEQRRKAQIIRGLLADDAEIRNLAQPRLAELATLIESTANQRKLDRAYES
jgi:flagellar protein FliT